jgi:hypothetical protein
MLVHRRQCIADECTRGTTARDSKRNDSSVRLRLFDYFLAVVGNGDDDDDENNHSQGKKHGECSCGLMKFSVLNQQ